jgi:hypothetical protein
VLGILLAEPGKDTVGRVFLLPWRIAVLFQNPVDELFQRPQSRLLPIDLLSFRRDRVGDRLPHHPAMHLVLFRQPLNRLSSCVTAPDLFTKLLSDEQRADAVAVRSLRLSMVHFEPPASV